MYCQYCGMQLDDSALYCSRCGKSTQQTPPPANVASALPPVVPPQDPGRLLGSQVHLLGILWAVYGAFRLMMSTGGIFFGRAMMRMSIHTWPRDIDPYPFLRFIRGIFVFSGILALVTGILGILAAVALLRGGRSGRSIALVVALLALISFPFGTALGIYTLIVLLRRGARENYERLSLPLA